MTYLGVSDTLIAQATKEEVAEVARVLALHVAHYRQRYGVACTIARAMKPKAPALEASSASITSASVISLSSLVAGFCIYCLLLCLAFDIYLLTYLGTGES